MPYELNLLQKLVALNTDAETKENYEKCANLIAAEAKKLGLKAKIIKAKAPDKKPRPNVLIELNKGAKETLLLVTHYDIVVPGDGWKTDPFKVVKKGNLLYGRGVSDDKGAIAAALGAIRELKKEKKLRRNVKLICACDEEVGGDYGIKYLTEKKKKELRADYALIMDGKISQLGTGCSGIAMGYIYFKGKQGHAAYPYKNPNILNKVIPFLNELKEYTKIVEKKRSKLNALDGAPYKKVWGRFNITILSAGHKTNIIPGKVIVGFDLRALPEEDMEKAIRQFSKFAQKKLKKYKLKAKFEIKKSSGYTTNPKSAFVSELKKKSERLLGKEIPIGAELGANDGRFFSPFRIPTIGFLPGGSGAHSNKEKISLRELRFSKGIIKELCSS